MARDDIEVVHVGSASRDLAPADPRGWRLGGGVTYAALTTARLGLRTAAIIGVDAAGSVASEIALLRDAGVDLMLLRLPEAPIFENRETPAGRAQVCHAPGVPLTVPALPERWLAARAWSLVPVADEVRDAWASALPDDAYVVVGWQGMLRTLVAGEPVTPRAPRPSPILRRADLVGVSHHDVEATTSLAALAGFLHPGADLLVTRGRGGGLLVHVDESGPGEVWRYLPTAAEREDDPTGAGDTFLAALTSSVIRPSIVGRARGRRTPDLRFAAAAGSLVVEAPGLDGVPDRAAVLVRRARERIRRAVLPSEATQVAAAGLPAEPPGPPSDRAQPPTGRSPATIEPD
jgi:sugar/nucleoside kinase (ribokinase family)